MIFEQPATFPMECSKVAFVITSLTGRACRWGAAFWESEALECQSFTLFANVKRRVFDQSATSPAASQHLLMSRQGNRTVSNCTTLATVASWDQEAQHGTFLHSLSEQIQDELTHCDLSSPVDVLIDLAILVNIYLSERQEARRRQIPASYQPAFSSPLFYQPTFKMTYPEPMQVRQRQVAERLCLYYGDPRHIIANCPVKGNACQ